MVFLYNNRDNSWIGDDNCVDEWYIAYHEVKSIEAIQGKLKDLEDGMDIVLKIFII